jgi:hypothetical protein
MTKPDFRALCAELLQLELEQPAEYTDWKMRYNAAIARARAALAQSEPVAPTDEELIGPIMWMLDDCVYDNDKGEIAQSLRRLIARWGTPANTINQED